MTELADKKIGLFGGTFNPIHIAHIKLAKIVKDELSLDEIWFIPTFFTPNKEQFEYVSPTHRIKMLELSIKEIGETYMKIKKYEIEQEQISYTYLTIQKFINDFPNFQFFFIMGDDQFNQFETWKEPLIIAKLCKLVVLRRIELNEDLVKKYKPIIINNPIFEMSSTYIRSGDLKEVNLETRKYMAKYFLYLKSIIYNELFQSYPNRFNHIQNVAEMAKSLAKHYQEDLINKAYYAGLSHDLSKKWNIHFQKSFVKEGYGITIENSKIVHAYSAALWLKNEYLLEDEEIIDAVKKHTTGAKIMSKLDIIVYVADKISLERKYPKVDELRKLAFEDINSCFQNLLIDNYKRNHKTFDQNSLDCYQEYVIKEKNVF